MAELSHHSPIYFLQRGRKRKIYESETETNSGRGTWLNFYVRVLTERRVWLMKYRWS